MLLIQQISKVGVRGGVANPRVRGVFFVAGMAENTEVSVASGSAKTDKAPDFEFSRAPSLEDMLVTYLSA